MSFSACIPAQGQSPYFLHAPKAGLVEKLLHKYANKQEAPALQTASFEGVTPKLLGRIAQKMDDLSASRDQYVPLPKLNFKTLK